MFKITVSKYLFLSLIAKIFIFIKIEDNTGYYTAATIVLLILAVEVISILVFYIYNCLMKIQKIINKHFLNDSIECL